MKKILTLLLSLLMIFTVAGCASNNAEDTTTGNASMPNPQVAYDTLAEINEKVGVNLVTPAVMGVTDEAYIVINDEIAEYQFSVNGYAYTFRASHITDEDISGVYSGEGLLLDSMDEDGYAADETGKIMTWTITENDVTTVYVLYVEDNGALDEATFKSIANEMMLGTLGVVEDTTYATELYATLAGDWYDETSQRAVATITNNGDSITIDVHWGSSYAEYTSWTMTAKYDSTKGLVYFDDVKKNVTLKDTGETESEEVVYENGEGYFEVDGKGRLLWTGAEDESCVDCVFVQNEAAE